MVISCTWLKHVAAVILCLTWDVGAADVPFRVSGPGPIRSALGLCIESSDYYYNVNVGNQVYVWDCDGTLYQQWVRPSAYDYRLQVSNTDLCMDLKGGNVNKAWDYVQLKTCSANTPSQQWVYDGFHIRLKYNTGLCLDIEGSDVKGHSIIAWPCDDQLDNAWVEYSISYPAGTYSASDTWKHLLCPVGSRVINISGWGGFWTDQLIMTCSDGTVLGPVGDSSEVTVTSFDCTAGYSGVNMTYGIAVGDAKGVVGKVEAFCRGSSSPIISIGSAINGWYGTTFYYSSGMISSITFRGDEYIVGMEASYGEFVNYVAMLYTHRLAASTTTTPTTRPVAKPTTKPSKRPSLRPVPKPTAKPSRKPTRIPTRKPTTRPSVKPTKKPTRKPTRIPTKNPTTRPSVKPTGRPTKNPTTRPSVKPTGKPTRKPTGRPTRRPTTRPTVIPTGKPTSKPSTRPSVKPTGMPTRKPSTSPSMKPTGKPTRKPSTRPSVKPTGRPTRKPSTRPSVKPTGKPTRKPSTPLSVKPTGRPTRKPSTRPSVKPTGKPTRRPTTRPSVKPTRIPTRNPTTRPSVKPTGKPTRKPSTRPSVKPTGRPTRKPSTRPSVKPTRIPTFRPTNSPTVKPTRLPTRRPTTRPSVKPTGRPTRKPTTRPTWRPTARPTVKPSQKPTSSPSMKPSARIRTYESTLYGIPSLNVNETIRVCPNDSKIVQVNGQYGSWIFSLNATCDDESKKVLTFGFAVVGALDSSLSSCSGGYRAFQITFGSYIGQLVLNCTTDTDTAIAIKSIGLGLNQGAGFTGNLSLNDTQRIVGFRTYYTTSGIEAMSALYANETYRDPSLKPTGKPTRKPSTRPSVKPSRFPTSKPSSRPSVKPTRIPTKKPTTGPSVKPTAKPTRRPTTRPSVQPTRLPTRRPTTRPSVQPTRLPTRRPTAHLSVKPTISPTIRPTARPSVKPSQKPTASPSVKPSARVHTYETILYGFPSLDANETIHVCPDESKIVLVNGHYGSYIFSLAATCDDKSKKVLTFGFPGEGLGSTLGNCTGGYGALKIKFGSYIGQLKLNCTTDTDISSFDKNIIGAGTNQGSGSNNSLSLYYNQRIVGFRTYYTTSGIQAMSVLYANITDPDDVNKDETETGNGMLSFVGGILAFSVPAIITICVVMYRRRKHHKQKFRDLDRILPLK